MSKSSTDLLNDLIFELESSLLDGNTAAVAQPTSAVKKQQQRTQDQPKKEKATGGGGEVTPAKPVEKGPLTVNHLDLRVGKILTCIKHATAETLYCEEIDVGEAEPRKIASGLVPYYTLDEMIGRRLIVVCNLKPRNLGNLPHQPHPVHI